MTARHIRLGVIMLFDGIDIAQARQEAEFEAWQKRDVNPLGHTSKLRTLHTPNSAMTRLHKRLVYNLRNLVTVDLSSATARPGGSALRNVLKHRGNRHFYVTDISDAFDSVDSRRLAEVLVSFDLSLGSQEVLDFLTRFCLTDNGGLITGSPSSADLFNIYCAVLMDDQLRNYCQLHEVLYSRYLDDLTFSSQGTIGARKREKIRAIVQKAGFQVGHHKSRVLDLKKQRIEINGIGLEYGGRVYLPRWYLRKIRGLMNVVRRTKDKGLMQKVHGMIGLLDASTADMNRLNRLEEKTFSEYEKLKRIMR